ncbi:MAG TPA: peptidylprolyl isomerase [Candidatus Obscuribacterales bacterium]
MFRFGLTALKFIEENASLRDVLDFLRLSENESARRDVLVAIAAKKHFEEQGETLPEEEIRAAINRIRMRNQLYDGEQTKRWLKMNGLTSDDLRNFAIGERIVESFKSHIVKDKVERYFALHTLEFAKAELYKIAVKTSEAANELLAQIKEGKDFFGLAKRHSIDADTRSQCGYMGWVKRDDLPGDVQCQVFAEGGQQLLGPFKVLNAYHVYWVERVYTPELDDQLRTQIEEHIFSQWLETSLEEWLQLHMKPKDVENDSGEQGDKKVRLWS